jgi:hypothetical protein
MWPAYVKSILMHVLLLFCLLSQNTAQVTPFKKSVLDSIKPNDFNLSVAYTLNLSEDGTSSLVTNFDAGLLYSTRKNDYEIISSAYFNRTDENSTSNRFQVIVRAGINSHELKGKLNKTNRIFAEPFALYTYDANRGINYRMQLGGNAVIAFKPTKVLRVKMGLGLFTEAENWQMITKEKLVDLPTYPMAIQKLIYDTFGIRKDGSLLRNNLRANFYANFMCTFNENISMNGFFCVQQPFSAPYKDLPQIPQFPTVTGLFPRITIDFQLSYHVWKKLDLITLFTCQYDQGQLPLYVPNLVYSLSQGFQISF